MNCVNDCDWVRVVPHVKLGIDVAAVVVMDFVWDALLDVLDELCDKGVAVDVAVDNSWKMESPLMRSGALCLDFFASCCRLLQVVGEKNV